ncbi:hypothetical protein G7062_01165 [Erysipelothrix sp. HDW6C]|uniref:hypothetical protein n=1 Tax=Erysipelothrix sp. HDW6C TaxID=2714930 RepID=UPI00140D2C32|nr:hypothetical protein [Erysipelothrix sp. HDW6C]QIK68975.1 hypothetical protein G7062_01165 [Erysipelothrix sp. HDW6C]
MKKYLRYEHNAMPFVQISGQICVVLILVYRITNNEFGSETFLGTTGILLLTNALLILVSSERYEETLSTRMQGYLLSTELNKQDIIKGLRTHIQWRMSLGMGVVVLFTIGVLLRPIQITAVDVLTTLVFGAIAHYIVLNSTLASTLRGAGHGVFVRMIVTACMFLMVGYKRFDGILFKITTIGMIALFACYGLYRVFYADRNIEREYCNRDIT